jgi:hypothetical protein
MRLSRLNDNLFILNIPVLTNARLGYMMIAGREIYSAIGGVVTTLAVIHTTTATVDPLKEPVLYLKGVSHEPF